MITMTVRTQTIITTLLGVALLVAGVMLFRVNHKVGEMDATLGKALEREARLEARMNEVSEEATRLRREAEQAAAAAQAAADGQSQAELEREIATGLAERSRADAELSRQQFEQLRDVRQQELDRMQKALAKIAPTERTPMGMVMTLGEDSLLFDFDKANLKDENREILSRIAGVLMASNGYRLQIFGHTDDQGSQFYNQQLSERRAQTVEGYLVDAGVPSDIMDAKGFGKSSPRARGTSSAARKKNRRVEIAVVDTVVTYRGEVR